MANGKPLTKTEIYNAIAEATGLSRKDVGGVFDALADVISAELAKGKKTDAKNFTIPGICKIVTQYKPAQKGGEKRINPFTKEEMITKPKPATQVVKVRPLKKLKDMVD